MARKLTRKQKRAYLDAPSMCPFCESDEILAGAIELEGGPGIQRVECNACKASWSDVYRLVDIVPD